MIEFAYAAPGEDATIDLRLDPPADAPAGIYRFFVQAMGKTTRAEFSIQLTIR